MHPLAGQLPVVQVVKTEDLRGWVSRFAVFDVLAFGVLAFGGSRFARASASFRAHCVSIQHARGCPICRIYNAKSIEMTQCHSRTSLSVSACKKLPCSKLMNPTHVVRAYWISPLNIQSGLTQDPTNSLWPSSALCQGGDASAPSSLKTAIVSRVTHHAHDTQKPKSTARAVTPSGTGGGM